ncbi:MAG: response regulator [Candidatus Accumulibacter sp.]|jgi:two-component system response regulator QseB|nr:response regulator [Accumulibacter sp.]
MRLLLVEDDPMIGASVQRGLKQDGHTVDWVRDADAAELALVSEVHELILLDLGLPRKNGLELLAAWRRRGVSLPVLVITARDSVADRVKGLDAGADDYLVKPFDLDELSARVRALTRRNSGRATPTIEVGALSLDPAAHAVTLDGKSVALSKREFSLLHALMKQPGAPMSRAQIEDSLYGWNEEIESNAIEVHIHSLRRKLGAERIRNVRGVGYMVPAER